MGGTKEQKIRRGGCNLERGKKEEGRTKREEEVWHRVTPLCRSAGSAFRGRSCQASDILVDLCGRLDCHSFISLLRFRHFPRAPLAIARRKARHARFIPSSHDRCWRVLAA